MLVPFSACDCFRMLIPHEHENILALHPRVWCKVATTGFNFAVCIRKSRSASNSSRGHSHTDVFLQVGTICGQLASEQVCTLDFSRTHSFRSRFVPCLAGMVTTVGEMFHNSLVKKALNLNDSGIVTLAREVHPWKAFFPMCATDSPKWYSPERCTHGRHCTQCESRTHPKWYSPERRTFQRHYPQCKSRTHPKWCSPERCTHKRYNPECVSRSPPTWCSSERCTHERHFSQCVPQTHPEWYSPERCTHGRHCTQCESRTHPKWYSLERCTLQRHNYQCKSGTHPKWCSPERRTHKRYNPECVSRNHPTWCSSERCTHERH